MYYLSDVLNKKERDHIISDNYTLLTDFQNKKNNTRQWGATTFKSIVKKTITALCHGRVQRCGLNNYTSHNADGTQNTRNLVTDPKNIGGIIIHHRFAR